MEPCNTHTFREAVDAKLKNNVSKTNIEQSQEYLLNPENNRLTVYPIKNETIWRSYKKQQAAFWTAEEIDFSKDYHDFIKLNTNEQHFIKMILAFFSSSDTIVNINISERFLNDVKIREAIVAYTWQMMMESIHSETYSLQIDNIVRDPEEKDKLFNAVKEYPCITEKAVWAVKWIESNESFAMRLLAFALFVKREPAPIKQFSPKVLPHKIVEFAPIVDPFFTKVLRNLFFCSMFAFGILTLVNTTDGPTNTSFSRITPS